MPKGGDTEGIMPPFPFGVTPYVPMRGLTNRKTPTLSCQEDAAEEEVVRRDGKIEVQFDHIIAIVEKTCGSRQIMRCVVLPISVVSKRVMSHDLAGEASCSPCCRAGKSLSQTCRM